MDHVLAGVWVALVRNPGTGVVTRDSVVTLRINDAGVLQAGSGRRPPGNASGTPTTLTGTVRPAGAQFTIDIEDEVATYVGDTVEDFDLGGGRRVMAIRAIKTLKRGLSKEELITQEEGTWVATKQG